LEPGEIVNLMSGNRRIVASQDREVYPQFRGWRAIPELCGISDDLAVLQLNPPSTIFPTMEKQHQNVESLLSFAIRRRLAESDPVPNGQASKWGFWFPLKAAPASCQPACEQF
jgi:hypothetical protein